MTHIENKLAVQSGNARVGDKDYHIEPIETITARKRLNPTQHVNNSPWVKPLIKVGNYWVTGHHSSEKSYNIHTPKSDYIVRLRRNSKKLRRMQDKREQEEDRARISVFDAIMAEHETRQLLNLKAVLLRNKWDCTKIT